MKTKALLLLLAALISTGLLWAAASGGGERQSAAAGGDAISAYAANLRVGPPKHYQNLVLYPIFVEAVVVPQVDLTLDKAMEKGLLEITELKQARVNKVLIRNLGKAPVFVMGGEMVSGAKQDRIVGDDLIVPAGDDLVIPVFCVEHGRWVARSEAFKSARALAGSAVRQARAEGQSEVWANVAAEQERLSAPSATGALRSVQESGEVQGKMKPYTRAFSDLPLDLPKARGVVAAVEGQIIAADLFSSRALFQQLWPKLLDSYVIDALERPARGRPLDAVHVKRWLDGLKRASRTPKDTPGAGDLYELRGGGVLGSALIHEGGVVHMELFRAVSAQPLTFNRLEFRRGRLQQSE